LRQVSLLYLPTRDGASSVGEEPHSHLNYEWDNHWDSVSPANGADPDLTLLAVLHFGVLSLAFLVFFAPP
jgi:hypothetical protein